MVLFTFCDIQVSKYSIRLILIEVEKNISIICIQCSTGIGFLTGTGNGNRNG